jgi:outer membrane protein assembly factor BamB
MFKLHTDKPGVTELWRDKDAVSNTSSPLLLRGHVFTALSNGAFIALDATTGKQVWKSDKIASKGSGAAAHLTVNGNSVLIFNDRGEVIRARLEADGYEELSRAFLLTPLQPFGGRKVNWTPAAYANGKVFARNNQELVCASLKATGGSADTK